jgi:hypothetical protein
MKVDEILIKYMKDNGYEGLENPYLDCFCGLWDFMPCGHDQIFSECEPAYLADCENCEKTGGNFKHPCKREPYKGTQESGITILGCENSDARKLNAKKKNEIYCDFCLKAVDGVIDDLHYCEDWYLCIECYEEYSTSMAKMRILTEVIESRNQKRSFKRGKG